MVCPNCLFDGKVRGQDLCYHSDLSIIEWYL